MRNFYYYLILVVLTTSCASNPHKKNNKQQKESSKEVVLETKKEVVLTKLDSLNIYKNLLLNSYKNAISDQEPVLLDNGINTEWIGTVNFNLRKPNFIIIHHTAQDSLNQTIKTFTRIESQVSSHYVISDDGKVVQMLNDYLRAWHAGNGAWGKNTDINSTSIGIELDNNGKEPFSQLQINSLLALLTKLKTEYNIPAQNIIGHSDVAPARKKDPSALFPWKFLADKGFGVWPNEVLETAPADFNVEQGLRIIGYDTKNLLAAITAFKLHYIQSEVDAVLDTKTINTIYTIYCKQ